MRFSPNSQCVMVRGTMTPQTHLATNARLCGEPIELSEGKARVKLTCTDEMRVDDRGLVHGGFVFGLADYAAMLAVNHPNVVLGSAQSKFLRPVKAGATVIAEAMLTETKGKKRVVEVNAAVGQERVMEGVFTCFVLEQHVLESR